VATLLYVQSTKFALEPDRMASARGGSMEGGEDSPNPSVTDLLRKLNLTEEEEAVADFSDEEEDEVSLTKVTTNKHKN
jgi:hypothetical protein